MATRGHRTIIKNMTPVPDANKANHADKLTRLQLLELQADNAPDDFALQMMLGEALHAARLPERALAVFEKALVLAPENINAVSACAALLSELSRPEAAYRLLQASQAGLMVDADGVANLAIAAEDCGEFAQALKYYEQALALNPSHLRSLNNLASMSAREGLWDAAITQARRCLDLEPREHAFWLNLADFLTGARLYRAALQHLATGLQLFPGSGELALRHAVVLAFNADFDRSAKAFASLHPDVIASFEQLLAGAQAVITPDGLTQKPPKSLPDPYQLYTRMAFEAIQTCDWREHDRLTATLRTMLEHCRATGIGRDWRDAQLYGNFLPMHEDEVAQIREISIATIAANQRKPIPAFAPRRTPPRDGRIHVGLALQSLRERRFANGLARQLQLHDHSRFCLHLYSPTPQPQQYLAEALGESAGQVVEIAHLTDDEAVGRMRLDELDIFVDMAVDTPWCRPEIPLRRVAKVQISSLTWHRQHAPQIDEYSLSDTFVHPDAGEVARYGAIVRFPQTCWIDANDDLPASEVSVDEMRGELGLPEGALVLCAFLPSLMIDPQTFATWMQILRSLPDAVLWLPGYSHNIQANLGREAESAGVRASRLVFSKRKPGGDVRAHTLTRMPLADLFVDALRFNANHGLVDALRMGVPAITCAGKSMASRLGGSIVRAAGLPQCVFHDVESYLEEVMTLGRDRSKLLLLKQQLQAARPAATLFDAQARIRECEAAWSVMAERARAGLPPIAFDIAQSPHTEPS